MDLDAELAGMDPEQLKEALSQAELQLEDVQEERDFTLGQTGVHIGANELERLRRAWETDERVCRSGWPRSAPVSPGCRRALAPRPDERLRKVVRVKGREYKSAVYEQFALIGKALCSGPRLEILDVLQQAERTVEVLAAEVGLSVANTSHHLQVLKRGRLVESERRGQHVVYRLADPAVGDALRAVRVLGERRLSEIERVTAEFLGDREGMEAVDEARARQASRERRLRGARRAAFGGVRRGHLAGAISMPLEQLERRLAELPRDRPIVAYCRGPYCVLAVNAVETLRRHGFDAVRAPEGVRGVARARTRRDRQQRLKGATT